MKAIWIVFFFCSFRSLAQSDSSGWFVGAAAAAEWNYRWSSVHEETLLDKTLFDSLETGAVRLSWGMMTGKKISQRTSVVAGVVFSDRGFRIDTLPVPGWKGMEMHYQYLEIPLMWKMNWFREKKCTPYISFGMFGGWLIRQKVMYEAQGKNEAGRMEDAYALQKANFGLSAALGVNGSLHGGYGYMVDVGWRQSLLSLSNSPFRRYLFGTGITIGIYKELN